MNAPTGRKAPADHARFMEILATIRARLAAQEKAMNGKSTS